MLERTKRCVGACRSFPGACLGVFPGGVHLVLLVGCVDCVDCGTRAHSSNFLLERMCYNIRSTSFLSLSETRFETAAFLVCVCMTCVCIMRACVWLRVLMRACTHAPTCPRAPVLKPISSTPGEKWPHVSKSFRPPLLTMTPAFAIIANHEEYPIHRPTCTLPSYSQGTPCSYCYGDIPT